MTELLHTVPLQAPAGVSDRERLRLMATGRKRSARAQDGLEGLGLFQVTLEQAIEASKRGSAVQRPEESGK